MNRPLFPISVRPADVPAIPGLHYLPEFISLDEEARFQAAIDLGTWDTSWKRRRQPFGSSYGSSAEPSCPIPSWGTALMRRIQGFGFTDRPFDQMLVNEYLPGQGISLHKDYDPFDRTVASVSLLSPCVMDFLRQADERRESLLLEPRSLLVLSDDARYEWQHGISPRKFDRWQGIRLRRCRRLSITFRTLRRSP